MVWQVDIGHGTVLMEEWTLVLWDGLLAGWWCGWQVGRLFGWLGELLADCLVGCWLGDFSGVWSVCWPAGSEFGLLITWLAG